MVFGNQRVTLSQATFTEILVSDKCFIFATFSTLICYGMFWSIAGSLIYEIKVNISEGMQVFGYLMMVLRLGKMAGHLIAMKLCSSVQPRYYPEIHLGSMAVQFVGVAFIPICTSWISLAVSWVFIGISLGIIESNIVFLNYAVNKESAPKYNNFYYFLFSLGTALTPLIVNGTKQIIDDPKIELWTVCWIVAGVNLILNLIMATILQLRKKLGIIIGETVELALNKPVSFQRPIISNLCLALAAFVYMCGRTILELYLLPYALYSEAGLTEHESYAVIQTVFISSMVIRLSAVFISPWLTKTINSSLLAICNFVLVMGMSFMAGFQDRSYVGMIITMVLYGLVLGTYQNFLLNWMTDRLALNTKNTAPFFVGTCIGSSITPAIVPHLIRNSDGSIDVECYQTILLVLFSLTVAFCLALMAAEAIPVTKSKISTMSLVEVINIIPDESELADNITENSESSINLPLPSNSRVNVLSDMDITRAATHLSSVSHLTPII